jgi:subtilase family serine protease
MNSCIQRYLFVPLFALFLACPHSLTNPICAQDLPRSSELPRIARAIDESSLVALHGNTHPLAQATYDRGPAPFSMPTNRLLLVLARSTEQEAALQTYLQSVQDANSPTYRRFLTPEEFGESFGVGDSDLQSIQSWLTAHGFTVSRISKSRMTIEFSGSVGQLQSAFHTSLHSYVVNGEHTGPTPPIRKSPAPWLRSSPALHL